MLKHPIDFNCFKGTMLTYNKIQRQEVWGEIDSEDLVARIIEFVSRLKFSTRAYISIFRNWS